MMNVCFLYSKARSRQWKLDLGLEMMRHRESTSVMDALTNRHDLRTVGELYDFLCERRLPYVTDCL